MNNTEYGKYATIDLKLKEFSNIIKKSYNEDFKEIAICVDNTFREDINKPIEFFIQLINYDSVIQINFTEKATEFINHYDKVISDLIKYINRKIKKQLYSKVKLLKQNATMEDIIDEFIKRGL